MNDTYDVIICGTRVTECILSGLLLQKGKKVLHLDRNPYYGDESASLNLKQIWSLYRPDQQPPQYLGTNKEWNIDLIPKFVLASGQLVKVLLKTKVSKYVDWRVVDGTYVLQVKEAGILGKGDPQLFKVPGNPIEALNSDLMGKLEKTRCNDFLQFVQKYDEQENTKVIDGINIETTVCSELVNKFELEPNTIDFIGHAIALQTSDEFIQRPALETIQKIKLYMDSVGKYGDSPFIYPIFGFGVISEGFCRQTAMCGGTFMLNSDIQEIIQENGKVVGVKSGGDIAQCNMVISGPQYAINNGFTNKVKQVGSVIRCICIMDHKIPSTHEESLQIILPQRQTGRKSDIYIMMVSSLHQASKAGYYIATISTMVENDDPEKDLELAFNLLRPVLEKFIKISPMYIADSDFSDNVFICNSLDLTSHFEGATENVLSLYQQITGEQLDLINILEEETG